MSEREREQRVLGIPELHLFPSVRLKAAGLRSLSGQSGYRHHPKEIHL